MKWEKTRLGKILEFQRGFDITKKEQKEGNIPIISSSGITSYHNKVKVKAPGIITGRKGTLGKVYYVNCDYWPHDTTLWVKDFKGNDPKFLYYLLQTMNLQNYDVGASNPTLNRNHLHKLSLHIPPLPIQRKIAAVLSAYDDLIENNTRRIAILERMAEEIYREWFVRLRFPGHERVKFQKGVPEGWEIKKLGDILTLEYGKALKQDDRDDGQYPVYGSSGIVGYHSKYLCKSPGIIVGRKGNVGSIYWSNDHFYPIDTVYFVKSDYPFFYIYFLCQTMNFINNDAAVPGLNRQQAYSNSCYLPSIELINKFSDTVKPIFQLIDKISKKISALKQSRNLLLARLMSGRLAVDDLDVTLPPSMTRHNSMEESYEY